MIRKRKLYGCPVEFTLDMVGGKWKTVILARLKQGPMRYGELRRAVPDLSDKVLSQRLRDLVEAGFVARSAADANGVVYTLTQPGQSLGPALEALYAWGKAAAEESGARFRSVTMPI